MSPLWLLTGLAMAQEVEPPPGIEPPPSERPVDGVEPPPEGEPEVIETPPGRAPPPEHREGDGLGGPDGDRSGDRAGEGEASGGQPGDGLGGPDGDRPGGDPPEGEPAGAVEPAEPEPAEPEPAVAQAAPAKPARPRGDATDKAPPVADAPLAAGTPAAGTPAAGDPPAVTIGAGGVGPNFLLVVEDLSGAAGGAGMLAVVGTADDVVRIPLKDDGVPPDPMAGDSAYVAAISGYPAGVIEVRLVSGEAELATTTVEIPQDMALPSLRVMLNGPGDASWRLSSDSPMAGVGASAGAGAGAELAAISVTTVSGPSQPAGAVLAAGLAPGLLLGGGLGWWRWGRRRREALVSGAVRSPAAGLHREGQRAWLVPAASRQRAVAAAALGLAPAGPVLVVPRAASRPALARLLSGAAGVAWIDEERPTVPRLLQAIDRLSAAGPVSVVVEGPGALEVPGPKEPAFAVVEELLELVSANLLVLAAEGEALPGPADQILAPVPGGLGVGGALVLALEVAGEEE